MLTELLQQAVTAGASDLHLSCGLPPLLRIDGDIARMDVPPLSDESIRQLLRETMPDNNAGSADDRVDHDAAMTVPGLARFRLNVFRQQRGLAAVFRVVPLRAPTLQEVHAPDVCHALTRRRHGLILVTGPTGSGKSTTLAAMIDDINRHRTGHILTVEDPIEYVHEPRSCLVNQREVHRHVRDFNTALRAALREDPDCILVGELRDLETIRLALTAAETGHLVLATLHTASAAGTVDRLVDVFPAGEKALVRAMLSESLIAVVSQILLKRIGGGRVAAHEVMTTTPAIRNLIREGKVAQLRSAIQTGREHGMQTLDQALQQRAAQGLVAPDEAAGHAVDRRLVDTGT